MKTKKRKPKFVIDESKLPADHPLRVGGDMQDLVDANAEAQKSGRSLDEVLDEQYRYKKDKLNGD